MCELVCILLRIATIRNEWGEKEGDHAVIRTCSKNWFEHRVDPFLFSDFSLAHFSIHKRNVALGLFVIIDPGSEGLTHAVTHSLAQYDT